MSYVQSFLAGISIGLVWLIGFSLIIYIVHLSRIRVFTSTAIAPSTRLTNPDTE